MRIAGAGVRRKIGQRVEHKKAFTTGDTKGTGESLFLGSKELSDAQPHLNRVRARIRYCKARI